MNFPEGRLARRGKDGSQVIIIAKDMKTILYLAWWLGTGNPSEFRMADGNRRTLNFLQVDCARFLSHWGWR